MTGTRPTFYGRGPVRCSSSTMSGVITVNVEAGDVMIIRGAEHRFER